jgi:diguanylate cyclase (GGDEF)-like protein
MVEVRVGNLDPDQKYIFKTQGHMVDKQESQTQISLPGNSGQTENHADLGTEASGQARDALRATPVDSALRPAADDKANSSSGGYLLTNEYGQIEYCDQSAAALLHSNAYRLINRMLAALIPVDQHQEFYDRLNLLRTTHKYLQWNTKLILADATSFPVQITVAYAEAGKSKPPSLRWFIQEILSLEAIPEAQSQANPPDIQQYRNQLKEQQEINQSLLKEIELLKQERLDLIQARDSLDNHLHAKTSELDRLHVQLLAETDRRENVERAYAQLAGELNELHAATQSLLSTLEIEPLIGRILDAVSQAIPACEKGRLYLIAKNTGQLEMRAMIGYKDPRIQTIALIKSNSYVARVIQERKPMLVNDIRERSSEETGEAEPPILSALIAPLILDGDLFGALCLESSRSGAFSEQDLKLLTSFAATATAAIRNASLHAEVQKLALTDSLTNLYNRRGFTELAKRELERSRRFGRPLSALMIDMDHFKEINDIFGHGEGDLVLRQVADVLKRNIREVDILGRYGGDEFNALLPETDLFVACNVAERLRQRIEELEIRSGEQKISVSASLGVAKYSPDIIDLDNLISRADAAMYNAKQSGRNRVEIG